MLNLSVKEQKQAMGGYYMMDLVNSDGWVTATYRVETEEDVEYYKSKLGRYYDVRVYEIPLHN